MKKENKQENTIEDKMEAQINSKIDGKLSTKIKSDKKLKKIITPINVIAMLLVLLIIAGGTAVYFYTKINTDPQKEAKKELKNTIAQVGRHMVLPQNETPTMATVSDPQKLQDQPFFKNAVKGDKVLIYQASKKAILYDPSLDRIIEVAPVNTSSGL